MYRRIQFAQLREDPQFNNEAGQSIWPVAHHFNLDKYRTHKAVNLYYPGWRAPWQTTFDYEIKDDLHLAIGMLPDAKPAFTHYQAIDKDFWKACYIEPANEFSMRNIIKPTYIYDPLPRELQGNKNFRERTCSDIITFMSFMQVTITRYQSTAYTASRSHG